MTKFIFRNSILTLASATFLAISGNTWAAETPTSQRMIITSETCAESFAMKKTDGAEGAVDLLVSFADTILDQVFSVVDKWIEKRKKDRTATYGSSELLTSGLQNATRCLMLVNGTFGASGTNSNLISGLDSSFYTKVGVKNVSSFFAIELEAEDITGAEGRGLGALKLTPYHAAFFNTTAKKGEEKDIVLTLVLEAAHNDAKKGVQKEELKHVFNIGEMLEGSQKARDDFRTDAYREFVSDKFLQRPIKVSLSAIETEDESFYEKVVTTFYEDEKDNIKEIIQSIWGTNEED